MRALLKKAKRKNQNVNKVKVEVKVPISALKQFEAGAFTLSIRAG